jgi:hypothetical protein
MSPVFTAPGAHESMSGKHRLTKPARGSFYAASFTSTHVPPDSLPERFSRWIDRNLALSIIRAWLRSEKRLRLCKRQGGEAARRAPRVTQRSN